MTFPTNHNSFSPVFRKTILAAATRRIEVLHDTPAQARSLAAAMRSYVGKLYKAAEKSPELKELAMAARMCMFRVEGALFVAQPRDMDTRFDKLKQALEQPEKEGANMIVIDSFTKLTQLMADTSDNAAKGAYNVYMGKKDAP
jgi:hypothetical protein